MTVKNICFKETQNLIELFNNELNNEFLEQQKDFNKELDDEIKKKKIKNKDVTIDPEPPRSFAYCSDTIYDEDLVKYVKGVDLLYHESTFLNDKSKRATETFHSTAEQAAKILPKNGRAEIHKTFVTRQNMMTLIDYLERYDTPPYCSPSCESYWSM